MNMIPGEIRMDAMSQPCIMAAGECLPLDPRSEIASMPQMKATLGIRPEDIAVLAAGAHAPAAAEAHVTMVEPLGAEFMLSFALGGRDFMAKIAGRSLPSIGESLRFAFNMGHAHVFDAVTGRSLRR